MMIIPYSRQSITEEDIEPVNEVLRSGWLNLFIHSAPKHQKGVRNA
jgi:dTDP-4-amino-4,6-dideoxygalactose transaminase